MSLFVTCSSEESMGRCSLVMGLHRLLEGRKVSMLCDMLRWNGRGSWRVGRRLTKTAGGEKVSMLCDMLRWSRRGTWRAGRRLTKTAGGEEGEHVV